jgi:uncharacterized repeat protein (TIGR01451 family)
MKTKLLFLVALVNFSLFSFAQNQNQNPNFTIGNAQTTVEGTPLVFPVTLNVACSTDVVMNFTITDGSGMTISPPIVITIPAGANGTTLTVPTIVDNISEPNETITVTGTIISGCFADPNAPNTGTGAVIDDDEVVSFTIQGTSNYEGQPIGFYINLSNPISSDVVFQVSSIEGTASNALDYIPFDGQITMPAGMTITAIIFPTIVDAFIESDETIQLCLTVISGNTLNDTSCATGTIIGNALPSISLTISSTYEDFNNDGFTNVGDVINNQYTVTNTGQLPLTNATVYGNTSPIGTPGSPLLGGPIPTLAIGATDNTTYSYSYVITQADINAGMVYTSAYVTADFDDGWQVANDFGLQTQLSISDGIKFNLFFDTNGNGVQNAGEQNYNGGVFTYQLNSGQLHTVTSSNGMFTLYENNPTNLYTIGCTLSSNNNYCNGQYTLSTSSYSNVSVTNGSGITTYNFPITTTPCTDLSVTLYNSGVWPRPGFEYSNVIYFKNHGDQTIASGTITFTKDNAISITSTSPITTATATGFVYNFANLLPNEERYIYVTMQVPVIPTVSLGQLVTNSVIATIPSGDMNVANNTFNLTETIIGSWDPNDKTESHGEKIVHSTFSSNEYLTYTIRFENTGTAEAINIRVNDVLDSQLDENSVRMVNASHPYVLDKVGSTLNWKFDGVNLPPSVANTQIGHGYVVFQVKPKTGFAVGDIIPNTANIYFDFNPAIVTNTVTTEFVTTLAMNEFDTNSVSVYPNPVYTNLNLKNSSKIDFVEVISVLGQKVLIQDVNDFDTKINMGSLEKGIYFVKVISEGKEKTIKIIKE